MGEYDPYLWVSAIQTGYVGFPTAAILCSISGTCRFVFSKKENPLDIDSVQ